MQELHAERCALLCVSTVSHIVFVVHGPPGCVRRLMYNGGEVHSSELITLGRLGWPSADVQAYVVGILLREVTEHVLQVC